MLVRLLPTLPERKGIRFSIAQTMTGVDFVLVWYDVKFIATIAPPLPGRENIAAITVNSKHVQKPTREAAPVCSGDDGTT